MPGEASAGFELGGGWITLGVDGSSIAPDLTKYEQMVRDFADKELRVPVTLDFRAAEQQLVAFREVVAKSLSGVSMGGAVAGPGSSAYAGSQSHTVNIETRAAEQNLERVSGSVQKLMAELEMLKGVASRSLADPRAFGPGGGVVPPQVQQAIDETEARIAEMRSGASGRPRSMISPYSSVQGSLGEAIRDRADYWANRIDEPTLTDQLRSAVGDRPPLRGRPASRASARMAGGFADEPTYAGSMGLEAAEGGIARSERPASLRSGGGILDPNIARGSGQVATAIAGAMGLSIPEGEFKSESPAAVAAEEEAQRESDADWKRRQRIQAMPTEPGSGTGGRGYGMRRSPLSTYGLAARTGIAIGAIVAAEEIMKVGAELHHADDIEAHPERILEQIQRPGSSINFMADRVMQRQAQELVSNQASAMRQSAVAGIPLIGSAFTFADELSGGRAYREDSRHGIERGMQSREFVLSEQQQADVAIAGMNKGPMAAERVAAQQRLQTIRNEFSQGDTEGLDKLLGSRTVAEQFQLAIKQSQHNASMGAITGVQATAEFNLQSAQTTAYAMGESIGGTPGANLRSLNLERQATEEKQQGALVSFDAATESQKAAAGGDYNKQQAIAQSRRAERRAIEQEQANELGQFDQKRIEAERTTSDQIFEARTQGYTAILSATHQHYQAEIAEIQAAEQLKLSSIHGATSEQIDAEKQRYRSLAEAAGIRENERVSNSESSSQARIVSAYYSSQQLPMQARLAMQDTAEAIKLQGIKNPDEYKWEINAYRAERTLAIAEHDRTNTISKFEMGAEQAAARDQLVNMPMAAQAERAVAAAREAVTRTEPGVMREERIKTERLQLQAMSHDLAGFRSGAMAESGLTGDEALMRTGFGLDLGGRGVDRKKAASILNNPDLSPIPGTNDGAKAIADVIGQYLKQALQGVSLFTTGS